ncbi:MAG: bifunctional precorrin-2 dehydrogenase/sirohydrochlorin ferrochelatase [Ilumatobacteraceae bacterium]
MGPRSPVFGYPVFLDLEGVDVLVVGGGRVALRKAVGLAEAGASVTVVAPELVEEFDLVSKRIERRPYRAGEAASYRLVITATNDPAVNAQVAADATAANIWVNSADDPANCSFILPAVARRGLVTAAVSTGGASPALAGRIREEIADRILTASVEAAAVELARQRAAIHAAGASTEDIDWSDHVNAAFPPGR